MVFRAGILFEFRKDYHKNDGVKRFHQSSFVIFLVPDYAG